MNVEKIKTSVVFNQIAESADGLVRLYYHKRLRRSDGAEKVVTATAIVKDKNLLNRLNELKKGTGIEIETVTYWEEKGIPTILINFSCKKLQQDSSSESSIRKPSVNGNLSKAKFASKQEKLNEDEVYFI